MPAHRIYVPNGTEDFYGQLRTQARHRDIIGKVQLEPVMLHTLIESWDVTARVNCGLSLPLIVFMRQPRVVAAWFDFCGSFGKNAPVVARYLEKQCPAPLSLLGCAGDAAYLCFFFLRVGCSFIHCVVMR